MGGGKRSLLLMALLVAVIAACAGWILWYSTTPRGFVPSTECEWQCAQCGHVFRAEADGEAKEPAEVLETALTVARARCPRCGGAAAERVVRICPACGTALVYAPGLRANGKGDGLVVGDQIVDAQCVNAECGEAHTLAAGEKPTGEWRPCRCTRCGKPFEVLVKPGAEGASPPRDIRCYDRACNGPAARDNRPK